MKSMAALGQQAELLVVLVFVETDSALERFFRLRLEAFHEIVAEHREAFDDGSVETMGAIVLPPGLCIGPSRPSSRSSEAVVFAGAAANVDREKTHEEKRAQQNNDDNRHGRIKTIQPTIGISVVIRRSTAIIGQYDTEKRGSKTEIHRVIHDNQTKTSAI
jgi:hypothetical protein